ncbi:GTP 3',8-cyclase MoaA [Candidatus Uabimicrobium amorphum]|uniref:GTP 3',8-cyclase n=1 Tax=Uabimicrobium amorphum TaxID=2596890 RepID=A0A5S9IM57_UABAM|nr:GTP 3',8-cyclase MoaA [Candidatus Uabimicrobium amorphum]BBM84264.1 cyclic pyranopterin monophosphate synthase [Candidatus Uabimicrobium amorphum]
MLKDLLQRPIRTMRISVIDACNFRCTYCMPTDKYGANYKFLPKKQLLTFDEMVRLISIFTTLGVRKIKITGGEPLLRENICHFISSVSQIPQIEDISLTTNGYFLPRQAKNLKDAGLHRITISLDSLQQQNFQKIIGRKYSLDRVLQGIAAAEDAKLFPIKINVVVIKGYNDMEILNIVEYFKKKHYIVRFIEYMDVGNVNAWEMRHVVPSKQILQTIQEKYALVAHGLQYGEVASRYVHEDGEGEINFISSVTEPFCSSCVRARLSAEGKLYTCLFASKGHDVKSMLIKSDDDIRDYLSNIWQKRSDRYSEERSNTTKKNKVEMYHIGG